MNDEFDDDDMDDLEFDTDDDFEEFYDDDDGYGDLDYLGMIPFVDY